MGRSAICSAGGTNRRSPSVPRPRTLNPTFSLKTGSVRMVVPSRLIRKLECPIQVSVTPPVDQLRGLGGSEATNLTVSFASRSPSSGSRVRLLHQMRRERMVRPNADISSDCAQARWGRQAARAERAAKASIRRRIRSCSREKECRLFIRRAIECSRPPGKVWPNKPTTSTGNAPWLTCRKAFGNLTRVTSAF